MKNGSLVLIILFLTLKVSAQYSGAVSDCKLIAANNWVTAKNYYLLALFEQDKEVNKLLKSDDTLINLTKNKLSLLQASLTECKDALCLPAGLKFTEEEIRLVSERLTALYQPGNALGKLITTYLIPSGTYIVYGPQKPAELLTKAWQQDAAAINHAIGVYAEGKKANYPLIDSISYNISKRGYYTLMYDCSAEIAAVTKNTGLFFEPSLQAALIYLEVNERLQAADYEPMAATVNKAAVDNIQKIKWATYPYSHILVPGAGPDDPAMPLSGEGMLRCKTAARQYLMGKAPFIVVSGGKVHPYKTKFNEAVEMKKYMLTKLHIPENAIIIEPHARHTTTNLRNDARLVFRYGIPFGMPGLIITDKSQNDFITNMEKRCLKELGYMPYKLGKRIAETELEFYPLAGSLQIDADEPMDP